MLTQQSALRYSHPWLNASAQNEDGVSQFSLTRATIHKSVTIATSLEQAVTIGIFYYKADLGLLLCVF